MAARDANEPADADRGITEPDDHGNGEGYEHIARQHGSEFAGTSCDYIPHDIDPALSRTIESEIIPRLLMAHRTRASKRSAAAPDIAAVQGEVEHLVKLAVSESLATSRNFVDSLHARGLSVESIVSDFLPAAARHVGHLWETDACTFIDVTFALSRLQQLLRHYAPSLEVETPQAGEGRRVLLSSMPGEQHTFGLSVVEEFFRKAAWDVVPQTPATAAQLLKHVGGEWFDVVGLSASADSTIAVMTMLIRNLRAKSLNQSVRVIIGGAAVVRNPDIAATVGADSIARNPRDGINQMEWMMRSLQQPC